MADTSTERARRSRAHSRGDHSLCRPQRCGVARAHDAGEHTRCAPEWCEQATAAAAAAAAELAEDQAAPAGAGPAPPLDPENAYRVRTSLMEAEQGELGPAGRALWDAVNPRDDLPPLPTELLREACRTTDRLRALDRQLRGDGPWLDLTTQDGRTFVIVVTDVLKEVRAQQLAFKQLAAELRQSIAGGRAGNQPSAPDDPDKGKGEGASIVDLSAAIRAKLEAAAQS